jgi:hypothetical protein
MKCIQGFSRAVQEFWDHRLRFIDPYKYSIAAIKSDFTAATRYLNDRLQDAERFMFLPYVEG